MGFGIFTLRGILLLVQARLLALLNTSLHTAPGAKYRAVMIHKQ